MDCCVFVEFSPQKSSHGAGQSMVTLWLCQNSYGKWSIYRGFMMIKTYPKWWFSQFATLNNQIVIRGIISKWPHCSFQDLWFFGNLPRLIELFFLKATKIVDYSTIHSQTESWLLTTHLLNMLATYLCSWHLFLFPIIVVSVGQVHVFIVVTCQFLFVISNSFVG